MQVKKIIASHVAVHQFVNMENVEEDVQHVIQTVKNCVLVVKVLLVVKPVLQNALAENRPQDVKYMAGLNCAKHPFVRLGELKNTMDIVYHVVFIIALKSKYHVISRRKKMM